MIFLWLDYNFLWTLPQHDSSYSGYKDELAWAALWLHRATGDADMLEQAKALYDECCSFSINRAFTWDDKGPGVQILMYKHTGKTHHVPFR